jgi:hypothetical protein
LASENFADAWATEEQYTNFRGKIHTYREWIDDAYNEQDRSESIAKWRRVFGEDFASGVSIEDGKSVGKFIVANMRRTLAEGSQFTGDLVDAIKRFGARVLPAGFDKKPYMEAPKWPNSGQNIAISVRADLHRNKYGTQRVGPVSSLEPLQPGYWLHFRAVTNTGGPSTLPLIELGGGSPTPTKLLRGQKHYAANSRSRNSIIRAGRNLDTGEYISSRRS